MLGFLAAPAEDEGVPAYEADHASPRGSQPEQQVVAHVLPQMMPSRCLAGEDAAGSRRNEVLDLLADEAVALAHPFLPVATAYLTFTSILEYHHMMTI